MEKQLILTVAVCLAACSAPDHDDVSRGNKFDDQAIREIYTLQDKRDANSLIDYFDRQEADYRREAAVALGSVQDTISVPALVNLLHDEFADVRLAAAYALGQIKNTMAEEGILNALNDEPVPLIRRELWEALGKCASPAGVDKLVSFTSGDSLEKEGMAWGIYRIGLRGKANAETTEKAISFLDFSNSYFTRLGAAHYLARTREIDIEGFENTIAESAQKDASPFVRMAAARALSKASDSIRTPILHAIIRDEADPRVIINAINSLAGIEVDKSIAIQSLHHQNVNVSIAAAGFVSAHSSIFESELIELADNTENWRARATLLGAGIAIPGLKSQLNEKILDYYSKSTNIYERSALLNALGGNPENHSFIWSEVINSESKAISTAGISALLAIRSREDFPPEMDETFLNYFRDAILTGDLAMVEIASRALRNPAFNYKAKIIDYTFLNQAKEKLTLPKDNETLQSLERTIAFFEDREIAPVVNEYNHPINWEAVKEIPVGQKTVITTSKGRIVLELNINEAPGSVENFYTLARAGYYNGKVFHRVVPNFVIQGGCPRGDGFGGEDYSIRSELGPLRYKEGSIGMASAGKDTEGVQWFITHSPTPHLDGSYSIFGQVTEGMDIVNAIEVGDVIEKIEFPSANE